MVDHLAEPTVRSSLGAFEVVTFIDTALPGKFPERLLPLLRRLGVAKKYPVLLGVENGEPVYDESAEKWAASVMVVGIVEAVGTSQEEVLQQLSSMLAKGATPALIDKREPVEKMRFNLLLRFLFPEK